MTIKVSVIIPSAGRRSDLLNRAIKSAIIDIQDIKTEILVILNGKQGMSFDISKGYQNPCVHYYKIKEGSVSKARNFGLSIAYGDLVRFLDDDDYLIKEVAIEQCLSLFYSNADLSTYCLESRDSLGNSYGSILKKKYLMGLHALLAGELIGTTHNNLYKYDCIKDLRWNENNNNGEDVEWFFQVLLSKDCRWIFDNKIVGIWYQHNSERLSKSFTSNLALKSNVNNMMKLYERYNTSENLDYYIKGLIFFSRKAFSLEPLYWSKILDYAQSIANKEQFHYFYWWSIHIKTIEWILLPLKRMSRAFKKYIYNSNSHLR